MNQCDTMPIEVREFPEGWRVLKPGPKGLIKVGVIFSSLEDAEDFARGSMQQRAFEWLRFWAREMKPHCSEDQAVHLTDFMRFMDRSIYNHTPEESDKATEGPIWYETGKGVPVAQFVGDTE